MNSAQYVTAVVSEHAYAFSYFVADIFRGPERERFVGINSAPKYNSPTEITL
jgi:hypothetical protein